MHTDPVEDSVAGLARLSLVELDEAHDPQAHRLIRVFVRTVIDYDDSLSRLDERLQTLQAYSLGREDWK